MVSLLSTIDENARFQLHIMRGSNSELQNQLKILEAEGIPVLNLGKSLSDQIEQIEPTEHLAIQAPGIIENLVITNSRWVNSGKRIIALCNFGILLEPELGLNPGKILADLSKRFIVLLLWGGEYKNDGILAWTPNADDGRIDLRSADPQIIDLNHEI
jgi:hypothetical protein